MAKNTTAHEDEMISACESVRTIVDRLDNEIIRLELEIHRAEAERDAFERELNAAKIRIEELESQ